MIDTPDNSLIDHIEKRLAEATDSLRYVLNWSDSSTRVSTVMKTFTLPDRKTTKEKLEWLYATAPTLIAEIRQLREGLRPFAEALEEGGSNPTVEQWRNARALLSPTKGKMGEGK